MTERQVLALVIALLTLMAVVGAFLYTTRVTRAERRAQNAGERRRKRRNAERIETELRDADQANLRAAPENSRL